MVVEAWALLKVTATPALLMAIPFGAMVTVQTSGLVNQVGASSLVELPAEWASSGRAHRSRQVCSWAEPAAAAIASDLGARAIRDELDALRVMALNPSAASSFLASCDDPHRADSLRDHHRRRGGRVLHTVRDGQRREQRQLLDVIWFLRENGRRLVHHGQGSSLRRMVAIISCLRGMEPRADRAASRTR